MHADSKEKNILLLGEDLTLRLDDTLITTEAIYSINFKESGTKFGLILHYNGSNTFLFANAINIYQFTAKGSGIT